MTYKDLGFSNLLYKTTYAPGNELTEPESSFQIPQMTGTNIVGGVTTSPDGRMEINYITGTIIISDGLTPRILIGFQEDGFDEI